MVPILLFAMLAIGIFFVFGMHWLQMRTDDLREWEWREEVERKRRARD